MDLTDLEQTIYDSLEDDIQVQVKELLEEGYTLFEALEELNLL